MDEMKEVGKGQVTGQVTLEMEKLRDRVSTLEQSVAELKTRLGPVLRDRPLDTDEKPVIAQKTLVPLADDIRIALNRVNMSNFEVRMLLKDLEL